MCFILDPLSDVAIASGTLPDTISMLDSIDPFAVVGISCDPCVETFATNGALVILSKILVAIAEPLVPFSMAFVIEPITLVNSSNLINADALAVAMTFD